MVILGTDCSLTSSVTAATIAIVCPSYALAACGFAAVATILDMDIGALFVLPR